jgi:hypothetical protein
MIKTMKTMGLSLCLLLVTSISLHAQEKSPQAVQQSCRRFVQGFYDWYIRKLNAGGYYGTALQYKRDAFSPELFRLLKKSARAASSETADYLDYDPFVNGQDWLKHYVAGKVTLKGDRCWVNVYGSAGGGQRSNWKDIAPDIVPELMLKEGRWFFVNFHDPKHPQEDLLSVLKSYYSQPRKTSK